MRTLSVLTTFMPIKVADCGASVRSFAPRITRAELHARPGGGIIIHTAALILRSGLLQPATLLRSLLASHSKPGSLFFGGVRVHRVNYGFACTRQQKAVNEWIDIAIQDAINVAHLEFGAVIFDQAIGLQSVGPNLAAETDIELRFVELARRGLALLDFQVVKARAQQLHGNLAVFVLAAFGLALHDDAGGEMRKSYRGLHFIHVLAAVASGAKCIDAQIFRPDGHLDTVVNFGDHEYGGKRSVPPRRLIEWRNANQAGAHRFRW